MKLIVSDSSNDGNLSCQTLIFKQVVLAFINNKYSSNAYWAYHLIFLAKVAEYECKGLFADWSIFNAEALHAASAQQLSLVVSTVIFEWVVRIFLEGKIILLS